MSNLDMRESPVPFRVCLPRLRLRLLPLLLVSLLIVIFLASCVGARPPSPADIEAKQFRPLPDKAVVYLYRIIPDFSDRPTSFTLDGQFHGSTYPGTYYRLELQPGPHRIGGFASDSGRIDFHTEPGRIYYVRQSVSRFMFEHSHFALVSEPEGRHGVMRAELLGARATQ